jgi:hypothetical protein
VSNLTAVSVSRPEGITAASDGAMLFASLNGNTIGRITTHGKVTNYAG